jgi:hypothetical protein
MNVASLDLCRELYELSGWKMTEHIWCPVKDNSGDWHHVYYMLGNLAKELPAYDLGYLVRKLRGELLVLDDSEMGLFFRSMLTLETLEDAAAKLAIELFKQGVLKRDGDA